MVKQILDEQLKYRQQQREIELKEKKKVALEIREIDKRDIESEIKRKQLIVDKVFEAKQMRDKMLKEAIERKKNEEACLKRIEQEQAKKLRVEIEAEQLRIAKLRMQEKQAALKVIHVNEIEKKKRLVQEAAQKREDARLIELEIKAKVDLEERRVQEFKDREARIQKIMNNMGDIVRGDKDKQL